ncbi:hypothetical protein FP74_gp096 [Bacillus phage CAM003]|uniref:Uncharacterized protein n=1 Tax=Bacillus phage CAM003 TaxID=1486657 RepID=A0A024AZX2_9CAUD|nr:hypothetical protein FP74_gp096 [Bacillus phage CAM003]AHZ09700.1 hypothetical protein [Bacillus phage CAM003]
MVCAFIHGTSVSFFVKNHEKYSKGDSIHFNNKVYRVLHKTSVAMFVDCTSHTHNRKIKIIKSTCNTQLSIVK